MRVTTLKASADGLAGLLDYYVGLAERPPSTKGPIDYYLDPDEPPGRWWGRGRPALGLDGEVAADELRALLEGADPRTERPLGRRFGDASARGFDATFSAPKSVSVLWALSPDPWVRAEVLAAHDAAVGAALSYLEKHGAVTRRGRDGIHQVDTRGLIVALFRQHTSRSTDPQLHTHALITAKVQDPTGRWLALDARFLKYQQRTIGWIYDAALRSELTHRLGVAWDPIEGGQADIAGVPKPLRDLFSERSTQIDTHLADLIRAWSADHDGADPDPRTIADLQRRAVLTSRPGKIHGVDATTLHETWTHHARSEGFDPAALGDALHRPPSRAGGADEEIIAEALERATDESSTWLGADLARYIATLLPSDGTTADETIRRIDALTHRAISRCIALSPHALGEAPCRSDGRPVTEAVTDRRLTTRAILDQETAIQRWATASVSRAPVDRTDPQRSAADAIAGHDQLVLLVGPAGTGKTTATARGVAALVERGRPVIGLAPSGKAADVLASEAGCPTATVASFVLSERPGTTQRRPGTTVIVDEAGMATTADLAELVGLARRRLWRLVLVGDPAQLPAVGRGGVFAHLCDTLPHHQLETPRRFHHEWEAAASLALRAGDPHVAETYDEHGRLSTAHPALVPDRVLDLIRRHEGAGQTIAITTNTAECARRINRAIQASRPAKGPAAALVDGTHARAGDVIATRRNDTRLATERHQTVRNRQTWTVTAVTADGALSVAHPDRGIVKLPADYARQHVELGWAVTGYGNQGDTVDVGIAVLEPGTPRNHAYVAMTRGRRANIAVLPEPTGRLDASALFAGFVERNPGHDSALAAARRLHRDAGINAPIEHGAAIHAPTDPDPATTVQPAQAHHHGPHAGLGY